MRMPRWTAEQLKAIHERGTNIIVSAGAGSGKTAVLTERVLTHLRSGVMIDRLLILTFTKAAAAEMKERIRKGIQKEPDLQDQLSYLDQAYITTFDSYALSVVKKYHYLLNISSTLSIIDGSTIKVEKRKIIDELFEEKYEQEDSLFLKMIGDLCHKDDTDIREYVLKIASKIELLPDKETFLETYSQVYFDDLFLDTSIQKYVQLLNRKKENIKHMLERFASLVDGRYYEKVEQVLQPLFMSEHYQDMKHNSIVKLPPLPRGSDEEVKKEKDILKQTISDFHDLCMYEDEMDMKEKLLLTKDYVTVFVDLLKEFEVRINRYKEERDAYEFQDIALMAIRLVKEFPHVQKELQNCFHEIMIDEYQDTSDLQETFISLISDHNVYMVGDIKQSIYRFRNANPNLFKTKYRQYSKEENGKKIDLNKNFRSRKEVLENINLLFDYWMNEEIGGAEYLESHEMVFGNQSYLEEGYTDQDYNFEVLEYPYHKEIHYNKEEIEAFIIAHDIKKKVAEHYQVFDKDRGELRDITYQDFVILMDRATDFDLYKKIFLFEQIPLTLLQDEQITNEMDMYVLKNLLSLILKIKEHDFKENFQYCFTSVARSFLFSYQDQEILKFFMDHSYKETELFQKAKRIADDFDVLSNEQLLERVVDDFSFYESYIRIGNMETSMVHIDYLFDLANNLSELGMSPTSFIQYFGKMIEEDYDIRVSLNTDNNDSVKMMTIHKSKGLEFPLCYYAGLYKTFNTSDLKERFLFDPEFGIIAPYVQDGVASTIYKELLKDRFMKEEISEKIRLFYVALTRAKEKMIFVVPNIEEQHMEKENGVILDSIRLSYRSFYDMLKSLSPLLSKHKKNVTVEEIGITSDYKLRKSDSLLSRIPNSDKEFSYRMLTIPEEIKEERHYSKVLNHLTSKKEKQKLEFGTEIHALLEYFDFHDIEASLNRSHLDPFYRSLIQKLVQSEPFQNCENATIYQEYEFYDSEENKHGIIDLMLEWDDHIHIVDYKLKNIEDEDYQKQLQGYQQYLKKHTNKPIQIYLYSLLEGTWRSF